MTGKVRRVVTGHDARGRSVVVSDGLAPLVYESAVRTGFWSNDMWRTGATPAPLAAQAADPTLGPRRQLPDAFGTVFRINHIAPEKGTLDAEAVRKEFAGLGNRTASTLGQGAPTAMMHRTETLDYAIVLSGEVYLVLDDTEVLLRAGDVAVQCGTNHAWNNRSDAPCTIAFILIDGRYQPELAQALGSGEEG